MHKILQGFLGDIENQEPFKEKEEDELIKQIRIGGEYRFIEGVYEKLEEKQIAASPIVSQLRTMDHQSFSEPNRSQAKKRKLKDPQCLLEKENARLMRVHNDLTEKEQKDKYLNEERRNIMSRLKEIDSALVESMENGGELKKEENKSKAKIELLNERIILINERDKHTNEAKENEQLEAKMEKELAELNKRAAVLKEEVVQARMAAREKNEKAAQNKVSLDLNANTLREAYYASSDYSSSDSD